MRGHLGIEPCFIIYTERKCGLLESKKPKKIVIATHIPFWRSSRGNELRIANLCAALTAAGFKVHVFFVGELAQKDTELTHAKKISVTPATFNIPFLLKLRLIKSEGIFRIVRSLGQKFVRKHDKTINQYDSLPTRIKFKAFIEQFNPDIILIEYLRLNYLLKGTRRHSKLCTIIDTHDLLHKRAQFYQVQNLKSGLEITEGEEFKLLKQYDAILAIQSEDANILQKALPQNKILTVPHGIQLRDICFPKDHEVVKIGFLAPKNDVSIRSLNSFLELCWPSILEKSKVPVELRVAGHVGSAISPKRSQNLKVLGYVECLDNFFEELDIFVHPLLAGSGLKIKIIEAISRGIPVVTTRAGGQGLASGSSSGIRIEEDIVSLERSLLLLINDAELRKKYSASAKRYCKENFSTRAAYAELVSFLTMEKKSFFGR